MPSLSKDELIIIANILSWNCRVFSSMSSIIQSGMGYKIGEIGMEHNRAILEKIQGKLKGIVVPPLRTKSPEDDDVAWLEDLYKLDSNSGENK